MAAALAHHQPLPAPPARRRFPGLPATLDVVCTISQPGGFMPGSGLVHSTYEVDVSGKVRVISPTHLYNPTLGRDLYPTREQFERLVKGEKVTLAMSQWA